MFARPNGAHPMNRLREEMDRLFQATLSDVAAVDPFDWVGGRAFPAMNLWEDDQNLYAEAEVPGMALEDIEVLALGNELTLKGERKERHQEGTNASYHRRERGVGAFSRTIRLPLDIEADKVEAVLKDGVLTVTMPKAEEARPRKIQVRNGSQG